MDDSTFLSIDALFSTIEFELFKAGTTEIIKFYLKNKSNYSDNSLKAIKELKSMIKDACKVTL